MHTCGGAASEQWGASSLRRAGAPQPQALAETALGTRGFILSISAALGAPAPRAGHPRPRWSGATEGALSHASAWLLTTFHSSLATGISFLGPPVLLGFFTGRYQVFLTDH